MNYGKHHLFHVWLIACLATVGFCQKVVAQNFINGLVIAVHHNIPSGQTVSIDAVTFTRDGYGMDGLLNPYPATLPPVANGDWILRGNQNWIFWQWQVISVSISFRVGGGPLQTYNESITITDPQNPQTITFQAVYGPMGPHEWYYRDRIKNDMQMTMEVSWYNESMQGLHLGTRNIAPGDSMSIVFGPFPNKQTISSKYTYFDGEQKIVSWGTNDFNWWDEGRGGTDPGTNVTENTIAPDTSSTGTTNLNNINWQTGLTNAGMENLAQEATLRQGFENLKQVGKDGFNVQAQKLTALANTLTQLKTETIAQNDKMRGYMEGQGMVLSNIDENLSSWSMFNMSNAMLAASSNGLLGSYISDWMGKASNMVAPSLAPISSFASNIYYPPNTPTEEIEDDFWVIKFMDYEIDTNPLRHPAIASFMNNVKVLILWVARMLYFVAILKLARWALESAARLDTGKTPQVNVAGTNFGLTAFPIVFTVGLVLVGAFYYSVGTMMFTGPIAQSTLDAISTNPISVWSSIKGVLTLVLAVFPVDHCLTMFVAYLILSVQTLISLPLLAGVMKAIPA